MNIEQVVRDVTIRGRVQGMDQVANAYDKVSDAADRTAVVTDKTTKAQISAEAAVEKLRVRYQDNYRQQQQLADAEAVYQRAVDQGRVSKTQMAAELANIQTKLGQATGAQKAMATASQALNLQVAALAGNLGLTGQVLSAFGPWGFAAAVGIGVVQGALSLLSDKAHELAQKAKEIKEFSEATGLTTTQFQALRSEAGKFGIDSETMASGLSKFTAGFQELRNGQGALLTDIRRVNPALADQMQRTTDAATAFTLFGKAVSETDNIFQRNALLKAGLGKGSAVFGAFFESRPDVAALTASFEAAGRGIDQNLIKKLAQLQIDIDKTRNAANTVFASMFGTSTLQSELEFQKGLLVIATTLKSFELSDDLKKFIDFLTNPATLGVLSALAVVGAVAAGLTVGGVALALGGAGLAAGAIVGGTQSTGRSAITAERAANDNIANFRSPANSYSTFQGAASSASPLTLEAVAEKAKNLTAVLGAAASPVQKLDAQLKALDVTARDAGFALNSAEVAAGKLALRQDSAAATIGARVGALGAAATVTDLLAQKTSALAIANRNGANLTAAETENQKRLVTEQANGVGAINAQIDALKIHSATMGMAAGAAAAYTVAETKRLEAIRNGAPLDQQQLIDLRAKAKVYGEDFQAAQENAAGAQANFELQTVFLSDIDKQIAQIQFRLHGSDWKNWMNDGLSSTIRVTDNLKSLKDGFAEVGKASLSAFLSGANGAHALIGALDGIAKKLSDKAFDNLTSLDPSKMAVGVVQAGASAIISAFTGDQKKQEELRKARVEWERAGPAFSAFLKEMSGGQQGSVSKAIADASAREAAFEKQAWEARDSAAIVAARAGLAKFSDTQKTHFAMIFDSMAKGFETGMGPDSAFLKSVNTVKSSLESTLGFIDDAKEVFGDVAKGENGAAAARATAAAQTYLLALLKTPEPLSQVQQGLQAVQGTASALQNALTQLGMSSSDAAKAISEGVTKAVAGLKAQFETGLTERLNTAGGQSFLNDATKLIAQHQQDLLDAASLGSDPALVASVFRAEAQKIVDDANLTGEAFTDFIGKFSPLKDVVHEFTQSAVDNSKAIADRILGFQDRLFAAANDNSTLEGQLAAQGRQFDRERLQEAELHSGALVDLLAAQQGEELALRKSFADKAVEQTRQAEQARLDVLNSNAKSNVDFINGLLGGSQSTFSAATTLANARSIYNSNMALAQSGNPDAQAKNPQLAENFLSAASKMFASGQAFQDIRNQIISQTLGLPAVVQTTDPAVQAMRDVLAAINAGNAAQATNVTLGLVNTSVGATTTAVGATTTAVGGTTSAVGVAKTSVDTVAANTATTVARLDTSIGKFSDTVSRLADVVSWLASSYSLLDAIRALQQTAAAQLALLNSALAPSANGVLITWTKEGANTTGTVPDHATFFDQMLTVLYHIRINTWATAGNTAEAIKASGKGRDGASFATGGWITGGIPGVDSVRLLAQQEEFMVNRNATRALTAQYGPGVMDIINAGRLPSFNDNPLPSLSPSAPNVVPFRGGSDNSDIRALLLQVEKLTNLVDQLRKENNSGNEGIAKAGREDTGTIVDALTETGKKRDATARETARSRRLSQAG